jgi:hypothetical protein
MYFRADQEFYADLAKALDSVRSAPRPRLTVGTFLRSLRGV